VNFGDETRCRTIKPLSEGETPDYWEGDETPAKRRVEMKDRSLTILTVVSIAVALVIVGAAAADSHAEKMKRYSVATGGTGGTVYPMFGAIAEIVNRNVKNVKLTVEVTAASNENLRLIQTGEVDFFISNGQLCSKAVKGEKPFPTKFDKVRLAGWMHGSPLQIAVFAKSNIKSLMDLKGKKVVVGAVGSGNEASVRIIFGMAGLTYKDFKPLYLSFSEGAAAMKDRRVDVLTVQAGYPTTALLDLSTSVPIRLIPVEMALAKKVNAKYPLYIPSTIPANIYKGQTEPTLVIDSPGVWGAAASVPADLVYQVVKLTKENIDELANVHVAFKQWKFEPSAQAAGPLHSGAIRYYKELGLMK